MITYELARQLKVAGLPWRPRRGDVVIDRLSVELLVMRDGTDDAGGVLVDTGRDQEVRSELGLCWLPPLADLLERLARRGPVAVAYDEAAALPRRWTVLITAHERSASYSAQDPAEAAGLAVLDLLA